MASLSVSQARARLSAVVRRAEAGEVVVITRCGRPVAEVRPVVPAPLTPSSPRVLGVLAGRWAVPDRAGLLAALAPSSTPEAGGPSPYPHPEQ